ncbi:MAG: Fungal chitosanase of glycosyl hydrolase group 75 [Bradyrhizobium sp.]|jgi:hypothetical protein|nr:Fungal chitosanase of glycosyl hydrolase group 75 [Bradyrhizobium sp.]
MKFASFLCAVALCLAAAQSASAQDRPSKPQLDRMISQLDKTSPSKATFTRSSAGASAQCGMPAYDMTVSRANGARHSFSVLSDQPTTAGSRNVFAATQGLASDADGSPRAYHPRDPQGAGQCKVVLDAKGNAVVSDGQTCALDTLYDGGTLVFRGTSKITPTTASADWSNFWSLIASQKLPSFDLKTVSGVDLGYHYYFFYWKQADMTVFFKDENVQRTNQGYPCVRKSKSAFAGYFVSATTIKHQNDVRGAEAASADDIAPAECLALRNIDSEAVPYFVIPGGSLDGAAVGDVVVARLRSGPKDRLVFGVAADAGPIAKFGEGSVLFNQLLFQDTKPVVNNNGLNRLDHRDPVAILILGGSGKSLNQNYTRDNIEKVAKAAFAKWGAEKNADPVKRFDACVAGAPVNPRR